MFKGPQGLFPAFPMNPQRSDGKQGGTHIQPLRDLIIGQSPQGDVVRTVSENQMDNIVPASEKRSMSLGSPHVLKFPESAGHSLRDSAKPYLLFKKISASFSAGRWLRSGTHSCTSEDADYNT